MRKTKLILCSLLLLIKLLPAQNNIAGIINQYHSVIDIDTCRSELTLDNATGLEVGMKILLIQMKGATIDESNSASFGNILNLNHSGNFEKGEILSISGSSVFLKHKLINQYSSSGLVQLINIPEYENATVVDTLKAQAWNGTTGGILAFEVSETLTLNAPISVAGQGFRGGEISNISPNNCEWFLNPSAYHYDLDNWRGSGKGEGIAAFIIDKEAGRGAQANGGGGGNDHNAGGGGGGNVRAGGKGGRNEEPSTFGCRGLNPGLGGKAITASASKIFLGGGGGAGHSNNSLGTKGANGGGIMIIKANTIQGNNNALSASGFDVSSEALGDGAGGGGGGGTVLLNANAINQVLIEAKGGNGGTINNNSNPRCMGPGGGGSGGRLFVDNNVLSSSSINLNGGTFGLSINSSECSDSPNQAEAGVNGVQEVSNLVLQGSTEILLTEISMQPATILACIGDTIVFQIDAIGNDLNYQWQIEELGSFQNLLNNATYDGVNTTSLTINTIDLIQNGIQIRCIVSNDCFAPVTSEIASIQVDTKPDASFNYVLDNGSIQFSNQSTNANNYSWDFGDNSGLVNTENPSHEYLQNGQYEVVLIASNECGADTTTNTVDITIVSTSEVLATSSFKHFPNPANDFLIVELQASFQGPINLRLVSLEGKVLIEQQYNSSNLGERYRFNIKELAQGVYTLQLLTNKGIATRKFVKF